MLPSKDQLTICFAHVAYRLRERFLTLATGIESFEVRDGAALEQRIGEADVLVISGLWRNDLLPRAKRLRLIQSIGARLHEAFCLSYQRGARACGRRAGARRRAGATADQGRRARCHRGAAAAAHGLAAVGYGAGAHHATYRRRDLPLRGQCARDHAGESRPALARRDRAAEPGDLDDHHCERPINLISDGGSQKEADKRVGTRCIGERQGFPPNPRRPVWSVPVRRHPQGALTRYLSDPLALNHLD